MEPRITMVQVHLVLAMGPLLKLALEVEEGVMTPGNIVGLVAMVRIIPRLVKWALKAVEEAMQPRSTVGPLMVVPNTIRDRLEVIHRTARDRPEKFAAGHTNSW